MTRRGEGHSQHLYCAHIVQRDMMLGAQVFAIHHSQFTVFKGDFYNEQYFSKFIQRFSGNR